MGGGEAGGTRPPAPRCSGSLFRVGEEVPPGRGRLGVGEDQPGDLPTPLGMAPEEGEEHLAPDAGPAYLRGDPAEEQVSATDADPAYLRGDPAEEQVSATVSGMARPRKARTSASKALVNSEAAAFDRPSPKSLPGHGLEAPGRYVGEEELADQGVGGGGEPGRR